MTREILPPERLRELLDYDPEAGTLTWRSRPASMFYDAGPNGAERAAASWNARYAGKAAGATDAHGYLHVSIFKHLMKAHRVAWAIHYGRWPDGQVDHLDHDRANNRIANLREATEAENSRNRAAPAKGESRVLGVNYHKRDRKWRAYIKVDGKTTHLGYFDSMEAAIAARRDAEAEKGFHPNHGSPSKDDSGWGDRADG